MEATPTVTRDGLRREAFFFRSGDDSLYGSMYVASPALVSAGVVICPGWGWEHNAMIDGAHRLAMGQARRGGAAMLLHWPGHGDSGGDPEEATIERLVEATVAAVATAIARIPEVSWRLVGIRLGAAAAVLAADSVDVGGLLLVQPALDPEHWFTELERMAGQAGGWFGGFPLSPAVRASARSISVEGALRRFDGKGAAARYIAPPVTLPPRFVTRSVPGQWRRHLRTDHHSLFDAAVGLLPVLEAT
jgi:alpha-beta hydrolase superfamily lysophospholipase